MGTHGGRPLRAALALVALTALAAALPGATAALDEPPAPADPLANGDFTACLPRELLLPPHPNGEGARTVCPPWLTRRGVSGPFGHVPYSQAQGLLLGSEGRLGVLHVTYDARDAVLLLGQDVAHENVTLVADAIALRVVAKADAPIALGARLTTRTEDGRLTFVPALGSPTTVPATLGWRAFELRFPPASGRLVSLTFEVHPSTPDGARLELERVSLDGAVVRPRVTR